MDISEHTYDNTATGTDTKAQKAETPTAGTSKQASARSPSKKPPSDLPFQLQVVYTDTEGAKAMRLLTKTKPVTKDRHQAERG